MNGPEADRFREHMKPGADALNEIRADSRILLLGGAALGLAVTGDVTLGGASAGGALLYGGVVLLGLLGRAPSTVLVLAMASSIAAAAGLVIAADGGATLLDRGPAILSVWLVAALVYRIRQLSRRDTQRETSRRAPSRDIAPWAPPLMEAVPTIACVTDRHRTILHASRWWRERLGYDVQDVVGRPITDFLTEESCFALEWVAATDGEDPARRSRDLQGGFVGRSGRRIDVRLRAATIDGGKDGLAGTCWAVLDDGSEVKRIAGELETKEKLYRAVFDQTFQFVAALDAGGDIVEANGTMRDFIGVGQDDIRGVPPWLLPIWGLDSGAARRLKDLVDRATEGEFIRDELTITGVADTEIIIDLSLKPVRDRNGAVANVIMEGRDITELRLHQEMLLRAQKMEAVGALTAGVAHDFNNILTVISGNLEILEKTASPGGRAAKRIGRAVEAVFRGKALTQQLLTFSRRRRLDLKVVSINDLVEQMRDMFATLGDAVTVRFDLDEDLPLCEIDPAILETVLLNIAINARDAMPEGGTLTVSTASLRPDDDSFRDAVGTLPRGVYACLRLTDTGTGMTEAVRDHAFDPFFTTKGARGNGLGLSMAYGFVNQSGGDIQIDSEPDRGTEIRLYFPATDKPLPAAVEVGESGRAPAPKGHSRRVLLVEDDDTVRATTEEALSAMGFSVDVAATGDSAIDLIRAERSYDLILTDMVMPGTSGGPEVAAAARAVAPGTPVIFCSGFSHQFSGDSAAPREGAHFLAKPYRMQELHALVGRALESRDRHVA
ncbi:MAG: PAS domain-containing protein [Alphaproteobacteria bacterium]|nr:PAS domain-containing protein [Alphaproteobacteria bacterium]